MKIAKSFLQANPQFDLAVAEHAERVRLWRAHMKRVEEDKAKGDKVAPIDRHQPYDRPRAPDMVDSCVDENGKVSYELEDDSAEMLRQQKNWLIARVAELEAAAIGAIVPLGRQRLLNLRETEIATADHERAKLLIERRQKPGFLKKLAKSVAGGEEETFDLAAAVAEQRSEEESRHLAEQAERRRRVAAIEKIAAQAMHDIEDLTAETVGSWKEPDFSGV